jgi:hypothetical protein
MKDNENPARVFKFSSRDSKQVPLECKPVSFGFICDLQPGVLQSTDINTLQH